VFFLILPISFSVSGSDAMQLNNIGVEAYNIKDYEKAIVLLSQALTMEPNNEVVRNNLSNALQALADEKAKSNDYRTAIDLVDEVLKINPNNFFAHLQMGAFLLNNGQLVDAIRHLETAVRLKPGYLDAHELLGEAYYRDNDILSAKTQWEYVLQVDPNRKELKNRYDKACREEIVEKSFNRSVSSSRHFNLSYSKEIPYQVRSLVLSVLERAYLEIGRKLGGVFPQGPIQVILYDVQQFGAVVQMGQTVGGVYDGKIRIPVINEQGNALPEEEIKRRIYHEYVHVIVYELLKDKVPWWVNEGLAETLSKDFSNREKAILEQALNNKGLISYKNLEKVSVNDMFVSDPKMTVVYTQSHATINMLWSRYGQGRFLNFIKALRQAKSFEDALRDVYHIDYDGLSKMSCSLYKDKTLFYNLFRFITFLLLATNTFYVFGDNCSVKGRIVDSNGNPIGNAEVYCEQGLLESLIQTRTNTSGEFEFLNLKEGPTGIFATTEGMAWSGIHLNLPSEEHIEKFDIILLPPTKIQV
jgi:Tfp pilus assembly protein PilF